MDSYSRYPNADTEGFWARLHQGTWRLVDGFNAEFCIDSPPVGPLGNLEGQDLVVNVAQGFDMLAEGENRRVLDKYVYGTPVAEDSEKAMERYKGWRIAKVSTAATVTTCRNGRKVNTSQHSILV